MTADLTKGIVRILAQDGTTPGTRLAITYDGFSAIRARVVEPVDVVETVLQKTETRHRGHVLCHCLDAEADAAFWQPTGTRSKEAVPVPLRHLDGYESHLYLLLDYLGNAVVSARCMPMVFKIDS